MLHDVWGILNEPGAGQPLACGRCLSPLDKPSTREPAPEPLACWLMPLPTLVTRTHRAVQLWARIHTMSVCIYVVWMNRVPRHAYPCQIPRVSRPGEHCQSFFTGSRRLCVWEGRGKRERKDHTDRQIAACFLALSCVCVSAMGAIGAGLRQCDSQGACWHSIRLDANEITTILAFRITHAPPCE